MKHYTIKSCLILNLLVLLPVFHTTAENICNETPPVTRSVDGIPAYAQCSTSTSANVFSNNGVDTRAASGGTGWVRTQYGGGYQCTEFAFRYLHFKYNLKSSPSGNAGTWGDNALPAGLVKTAVPVHGDLIIFAPGSCGAGATTGHVAVIDSIADSSLFIVEQNMASRRRCKASCAKCFLHAEANTGMALPGVVREKGTTIGDVTIKNCGKNISILLTGGFASGASVNLYDMRGRKVAGSAGREIYGHVTFGSEGCVPASLLCVVRKGTTSYYRKVVTVR